MGPTSKFNRQEITGMILAGGSASRMNHLDKGLQSLNGQSLVAHVIKRLQPQVGQLAINANRHIDQYRQFGYPVWSDCGLESPTDREFEFRGPLAGVETGLIHCATPYLLVVPCDSPFLPTNLAERLGEALGSADIAVACTGRRDSPRLQPVFCLLNVSMLGRLQQFLHAGGRKMDGWYGDASVVRVYFANEDAFSNINTLQELQSCASQLRTP